MSSDSPPSQDTTALPEEPRRYHAPSTPPPQSTDLGHSVRNIDPHLPPRLPSPPHPPHPHPPSPIIRPYIAPTETEVSTTLSAEGNLREVHQIIAQYILAHEPDPVTGDLDLSMFRRSLGEAIVCNQPAVVSYLFRMRVGEPSEYVYHALLARSISVFEVFLRYGWDINQPVWQTEPPMLG